MSGDHKKQIAVPYNEEDRKKETEGCFRTTRAVTRTGFAFPFYVHECEQCKMGWSDPYPSCENAPCQKDSLIKNLVPCVYRSPEPTGEKIKIKRTKTVNEGTLITVTEYDVFPCSLHKECMPAYFCDKQVLMEDIVGEDGREIKDCKSCKDRKDTDEHEKEMEENFKRYKQFNDNPLNKERRNAR